MMDLADKYRAGMNAAIEKLHDAQDTALERLKEDQNAAIVEFNSTVATLEMEFVGAMEHRARLFRGETDPVIPIKAPIAGTLEKLSMSEKLPTPILSVGLDEEPLDEFVKTMPSIVRRKL